jgi:hypothetical protein
MVPAKSFPQGLKPLSADPHVGAKAPTPKNLSDRAVRSKEKKQIPRYARDDNVRRALRARSEGKKQIPRFFAVAVKKSFLQGLKPDAPDLRGG